MFLAILLQAAVAASIETAVAASIAKVGAAIGAAIAVVGAARGIGSIGSTALESIARQPEAAGDIRSAMILSAALIEGVAMFAVVVCFLVLFV